ncbi:MAG: acyl-CoA desaturase [Umezawaea sp.]
MSTSEVQAVSVKRGSDFAELSRAVNEAGLLERRTAYYAVRIALNLLAFAGGWVVFFLVGDTWWQLFTAAFLAFMCTQLAFIGHDAGHKQIFRTRRPNDVIGYAHAGLIGMSYGWWVGKHNRHHANPNHEDEDPDIDIGPLAFTVGQGDAKRGFQRWTAKHQAFLFFPMLLLEGFDLHLSGINAVRKGAVKARLLEAGALVVHLSAYLTAVFVVLSPLTGVVFVLVHQGLWGLYMGCSFAPNHKGMPTLTAGHTLDFLRKQVLTSRNVRGGLVVDFALGGLNYQIEHHLFPSMPRPSLRHAQVIVREFCAQRGIDYAQCGWAASYGYVLRHLHAVGAPLRSPEPVVTG